MHAALKQAYQDKLREYEMIGSMSHKENYFDNPCNESFHSVRKRELVYLEKLKTRKQVNQLIFEYIEIEYNPAQIHPFNGFLTPVEDEGRYSQALRIQAS
ncbi:IS3 family transposase [Sulfoacidibacillus ferrooxidans]|uniref:IS3 family transposase n=1 Tax=Sulfoacidibacillus ferrooxidans TaxID=2005001 RepID=UPI001F50BBD2